LWNEPVFVEFLPGVSLPVPGQALRKNPDIH
jgi:hypothetical protein